MIYQTGHSWFAFSLEFKPSVVTRDANWDNGPLLRTEMAWCRPRVRTRTKDVPVEYLSLAGLCWEAKANQSAFVCATKAQARRHQKTYRLSRTDSSLGSASAHASAAS